MKKKGFTLIELLAVIVILALIALVLIPIMTGVIKDAKAGTAERSAANYIATVNDEVLRQKMKGNPIEDGNYLINQNGDLCPLEEGVNCSSPIMIEANGDKPTSGTVVIQKGLVITTTIIVIGDYTVKYDETKQEYVARDENSTNDVTKLCRPAAIYDVSIGNIPTQGEFNYGDEYICDLGDGVERRFFLLEDGDDSTLTKGDFSTTHYETDMVGTAGAGEVALIMNQNIDSTTLAWCASGSNNSCNGDGAKAYLKSQTVDKGWKVEVNLPTYAQIQVLYDEQTSSLPIWLCDYLINTMHPVADVYGYFTSTLYEGNYSAWTVYWHGKQGGLNSASNTTHGVRPVITISKNQLG